MGFVGDGGNIAIVTSLLDFFVFACVNIYQFMDLICLLFYACLGLRFLDMETNPGPERPVPGVSRIPCSNVRGLSKNLNDLTGFVAVGSIAVLRDPGLR